MFAHVETLIGSINYQCIVQQPFFLQIVEHTSYVIIKRLHGFHVVAHITLELPVGQFFSCQILFVEIIDNRSIELVPCGTLSFVHASEESFIK